jgi:drug/metabolite transporter (DMT)-like permease
MHSRNSRDWAALLCTVAPAFLMDAAIRRIGADRAAIVASIGPVATLGLAYVVLHETLGPYQIAGSVMVLGGVLLVALSRQAHQPKT